MIAGWVGLRETKDMHSPETRQHMQVHVAATDSAPASSYQTDEVWKFVVRWCFFAAG